MDTFFNIGGWELLVILFIAGIVMGPKRIREVAHWLGKTTAQLRQVSHKFMQQLNDELDAVDKGEMKAVMDDMQELKRELQSLRRELVDNPGRSLRQSQAALRDDLQVIERTIAPPVNMNRPSGRGNGSNGHSAEKSSTRSPQPGFTLPKPVDVPDDPE